MILRHRIFSLLVLLLCSARVALAGSCASSTSSAVHAIPCQFYVVEDTGRWITLAATSTNITWTSVEIAWPVRYKAFRVGDGGAAITEWKLDTVPPNGTLYEGTTAKIAGDTITDPDDLYYEPDLSFTGTDVFGYCVTDSTGRSTVQLVQLHVHAAATYPMPLGIPNPGFGINESPPSDPPEWPSGEATGYYYIDSDHGSCSDSNTYGYPNVPRCTIANASVVGAGKKMVLAPSASCYPLRNFAWHQIFMNGASGNPAWIVGDERGPSKPCIVRNGAQSTEELRIETSVGEGGGYWRISGVDIDGAVLVNRGTADHIVFRYSRARNNPSTATGGTSVGLSTQDASGTHVFAFHVNAHDHGVIDETLTDERDIHAFVGTKQQNFWILDSLCAENAGDCVQLTNNNTTSNVYVGRLAMHSMMENCIDYKDFNQFVVSESDCWDLRKVAYSGGSGGNAQNFYVNDEGVQQNYGYFLNNRSWDTSGQNYGTANIGGRVYFIGNRAFFAPQGAGLAGGGGGGARHYYFNTVHGMLDGLNLFTAGGAGDRYAAGNVVLDAQQYGGFASASYSDMEGWDYTIYDSGVLMAWGSFAAPTTGTLAAFTTATTFDANSQATLSDPDAPFQDALAYDFRLVEASVLRDGVSTALFATIAPGLADVATDLGISTLTDFAGNPRSDSAWDFGAAEFPTAQLRGVRIQGVCVNC